MRSLTLTNTPVDTAAVGEILPFVANNSVLVFNFSGGSLIVQTSDDGVTWTGSTTTQYTCIAGITAITIDREFIRVSTAATVFLVQN